MKAKKWYISYVAYLHANYNTPAMGNCWYESKEPESMNYKRAKEISLADFEKKNKDFGEKVDREDLCFTPLGWSMDEEDEQ